MSEDGRRRRKQAWSKSIGNYGHRIRVFEDPNSGIIYGEMRDPAVAGRYRSISLRHRDREKAVRWAKEQVGRWMTGETEGVDRAPTLARVLALYLRHQSGHKVASEQKADDRRSKMWVRILGPAKDLAKLSMHEWQVFVTTRRSGAINCHGLPVASDERKLVRDGTVEGDLTFLLGVLNWATRWREADRYLMPENPARGYPLPREKNPRRPVVTQERFERVRNVAPQVRTVRGLGKAKRELPTYLPEVLDLCWHTGRRISAILALRFADLRLTDGPHGSILWPAASDKMGKESLAPVSKEVRDAIDRILAERPGIGAAYLFPAINDATKPIAVEVVSTWLRAAEILGGVPKQNGSLFHAYRRGWATSRKHWPVVDVMATGGWGTPETLLECYQHADMETMYRVVSEPARPLDRATSARA